MSNLFNAAESSRRKEAGIAQATSFPHDEPVARARSIAIMMAKRNGTVCADQVYRYLQENLPDVLEALQPAAWGGVFRSKNLVFTGRVVESKRIVRHSGVQRLWAYKESN